MEKEINDTETVVKWKEVFINYFLFRTVLLAAVVAILGLFFEAISAGKWAQTIIVIGIWGIIINFLKFLYVAYLKVSKKLTLEDGDQQDELEE